MARRIIDTLDVRPGQVIEYHPDRDIVWLRNLEAEVGIHEVLRGSPTPGLHKCAWCASMIKEPKCPNCGAS